MHENDILILDTVTKLDRTAIGKVAIAASHGGVYAGYLAARCGVKGVILHDAGVGKDHAGISSLPYLNDLGIACATVAYGSARIGDGAEMARQGIISHANATAASLGCASGQSAMDCARAMLANTVSGGEIPGYDEARFILRERPGEPTVIGCDSTSLVRPEDQGRIVVTASHGDLLKTAPSWGNRPDVLAAIFNDAGAENPTRLPDLDTRQIAGATVSTDSARIGEARSTYEDGIISHVNDTAYARGGRVRMGCVEFVEAMIESARKSGT